MSEDENKIKSLADIEQHVSGSFDNVPNFVSSSFALIKKLAELDYLNEQISERSKDQNDSDLVADFLTYTLFRRTLQGTRSIGVNSDSMDVLLEKGLVSEEQLQSIKNNLAEAKFST